MKRKKSRGFGQVSMPVYGKTFIAGFWGFRLVESDEQAYNYLLKGENQWIQYPEPPLMGMVSIINKDGTKAVDYPVYPAFKEGETIMCTGKFEGERRGPLIDEMIAISQDILYPTMRFQFRYFLENRTHPWKEGLEGVTRVRV
jgi:hypothetical protein